MIHQVKSQRSLDEIAQGLHAAAARHSFGVIAVHDLRQTMASKGVPLGMDCRIFEVCNPRQAQRVLAVDGAISTALPCRISVYGHPGDYTIATMLPTAMMKVFDTPGLALIASEVETVVRSMIEEAA